MENEHVLSGLIRKRAEIAGRLEVAHNQVRQLIIDLDAVDATIRLFAPDIDLAEIKPKPLPPRHSAFKGEIMSLLLRTMREAGKPLHTRELAQLAMLARGLNAADRGLAKTVQKRVGASLRHLRGKGIVASEAGRDGVLWRVAE